jgi:hypothetical protein
MSFFKSNTTTTTTETTNTANQETGNNNGGLLKGLAIGIGTVAGIGLAAFGGTKAYKHFHVKDENRLDDVTDNETPAENAEDTTNETTVESFNEVDTEEPANEAPVEAEEAKTEETANEAPVKAEEAETEETKDSETAKAEEAKADVTKNVAPAKAAATKETSTMRFERLLGEAVSRIPYDKPESVDLAFYIRCIGGYLHEIDMDDAGNTGRFVIAEQCLAMTDLVSRAIIHIGSTNISDLDEYRGVYGDIKRLQQEFKASKIMDFTQKPELCKEKFEETLNMVAQNLKLTKEILKMKEAKPAASKSSAGETQTVDKAEGETKTSTKKVTGETKTVTKAAVKKQTKTKASKTVDALSAINQFAETSCEEMVKSSLKSLASLDYVLDVKDQKPCEWLHEVAKHVDSNIDGLLKTNHATEAFKLTKTAKRDIEYAVSEVAEYMIIVISNAATVEDLDNIKASVAALSDSIKLNHIKVYQATINRINDVKTSLNNMYTQIKTAAETKTAEPVVDETQATKEVPSETKIGNSEVLSDDGETVTLKASVPEDSVQNVMDVIDIVSKIPNRENPEKNDMPYYIRVIGGKISGITEPEATFLAYNDKTKSNDFIDACVSLCNMVGTGICNLADQKSNPIGSLGWINRSYDELIASGVIDNTYNPQAMRDVLTKARDEATRVLADMVKKSNETQDEANSSGETKTEETLTYTMSDKIQEAVQQSDETAATTEPESTSQAPMSPEASSLAAKLQEVGKLMRAEKWSDASEFYKTQLTPYLADDGLTKELREEIMSIKTKATNMMMSQKQLEAKKKAASAKASKKKSSKRRRH